MNIEHDKASQPTLVISHRPTGDDVIRIPLAPGQLDLLRRHVDPLADDDPTWLPLANLHLFLSTKDAPDANDQPTAPTERKAVT